MSTINSAEISLALYPVACPSLYHSSTTILSTVQSPRLKSVDSPSHPPFIFHQSFPSFMATFLDYNPPWIPILDPWGCCLILLKYNPYPIIPSSEIFSGCISPTKWNERFFSLEFKVLYNIISTSLFLSPSRFFICDLCSKGRKKEFPKYSLQFSSLYVSFPISFSTWNTCLFCHLAQSYPCFRAQHQRHFLFSVFLEKD